jgi:hypothetical protein
MNETNLRLVIEALRSGTYRQGIGWLRNHDRYCCLGVTCDIYHQETGRGQWRVFGFDGDPVALQNNVRNWIGFNSKDGPAIGRWRSSAFGNDKGMTFLEIADAWEALLTQQLEAQTCPT